MNDSNLEGGDAKLHLLLQESRPSPSLPPGFRRDVWKRIDGPRARAVEAPGWVEQFALALLRPRFALAGITAVLLLGMTLGAVEGASRARETARDRYVAAVSPLAPQ